MKEKIGCYFNVVPRYLRNPTSHMIFNDMILAGPLGKVHEYKLLIFQITKTLYVPCLISSGPWRIGGRSQYLFATLFQRIIHPSFSFLGTFRFCCVLLAEKWFYSSQPEFKNPTWFNVAGVPFSIWLSTVTTKCQPASLNCHNSTTFIPRVIHLSLFVIKSPNPKTKTAKRPTPQALNPIN